MKRLRFVNPNAGAPKDTNWFSKVGALAAGKSPERDAKEPSRQTMTNWTKRLLSKEDEIEIAKSMIPQFIQKQKELQPQYEYIKQVGQELKDLKKEYNITAVKLAKPQQVTSFMTLTGSQLREYEERTKETRDKRAVQHKETARARGKRLSKERNHDGRDGSFLKEYSQGKLESERRPDSRRSDGRR